MHVQYGAFVLELVKTIKILCGEAENRMPL